MVEQNEIRDAIIDTAVSLAAQKSWEAVRLYDIAHVLNLPLLPPSFRYGVCRDKSSLSWFLERHRGIFWID